MKISVALFFLFLPVTLFSQILDPAQWETRVKKLDDQTLAIFIIAKLDSGWHLYSQHLSDAGPVKTSISLSKGEDEPIIPAKPWTESGISETVYDSTFNMDLTYFSGEVIFASSQKRMAV